MNFVSSARRNTSASDFDATLIVARRTVVVLTCPGAMRKVYAPYLGGTLQKLMTDLDTIGERRGGPLPAPVGVIIDEFPTLGRLDNLVEAVNLVRKRRISVLVGAQTKGQFHLIYGEEATKALFTGLATQIVYGACDYDTAKFYSDAAGTATVDANPDPQKANLRQRPLLTPDEIINPQYGNCTIFSRFAEATHAMQVVVMAELTRLYEREDWKERLAAHPGREPLLLERGLALRPAVAIPDVPTQPVSPAIASASRTQPAQANAQPVAEPKLARQDTASSNELDSIFGSPDYLQTAARMQTVRANALAEAGVKTATLADFKQKYGQDVSEQGR